jgi:Tol biopolymer transport system component
MASAVIALGLLAGSTVGAAAQQEDAAASPSPAASPVGIVAIGHSGLTGENTDPSLPPFSPVLENSWATGSNPEVESIYQRLVAVRPETAGHASNQAQGGAGSNTLASQAKTALEEVPNPALVIIQTIDGDIRCDGSDAEHVPTFGAFVTDALEVITGTAPDARILMVSQSGRPATYAELLMDHPEAIMGGTGICDFFDPDGQVVPEALDTLTGIIEAYEAEQARVCALYPQCGTDDGLMTTWVDDATLLSHDWNHLSVEGHARKAEMLWPVVADILGIATDTSQASDAAADSDAWIAYQTDRGSGDETWLVHPDGSEDHQIDAGFNGDLILPNWSPDGQRLVMTSRATGGVEPLYEYDLASETYQQLFACEDPCLGDDEPVYSPDGTTVAFIRYLGPFTDAGPSDCSLWMGDLGSREVRRVTDNDGCDREYFPHWSPDGSQLTYMRIQWTPETGTTGTAVFVIDADGTNERQLTEWETMAGDPDWSPDGEWIVYSTYPLGEFGRVPAISNLYRIHPDSSGTEQLTFNTDTTQRATQPRYTPDGESIVFTAVVPAGREIWVMPAAGGAPTVVAAGGIHTHPTWQPVP